MQVIPLQAIPNQRFNIVLGDQNCTLHIYQRGEYMYLDLFVDKKVIRQGVICLVNVNLLNYPAPGFSGYLFLADSSDAGGTPVYNQLGSRYTLFYMTEEEANV